jgi:hypothetical protein
MSDVIARIKDKFYKEDTLRAFKLLKRLDPSVIAAHPELAILAEDYRIGLRVCDLITDVDGWNRVSNKDHISTFCRGKGKEFFVRAEMEVDAQIFPVLALFSEVDLFTQWISVVKEAKQLAMPSPFRRLLQYRLKLPWPVSNRECVVSVCGIPVPSEQSVLIVLRSHHAPSYLGFHVPPPLKKEVRMDLSEGCVNITYLGPSRSRVTFIIRSDPHLTLLPQSLINYGTKKVMHHLMAAIRQKVLNYAGSEYEARVKGNPAYYRAIAERIGEYAFSAL